VRSQAFAFVGVAIYSNNGQCKTLSFWSALKGAKISDFGYIFVKSDTLQSHSTLLRNSNLHLRMLLEFISLKCKLLSCGKHCWRTSTIDLKSPFIWLQLSNFSIQYILKELHNSGSLFLWITKLSSKRFYNSSPAIFPQEHSDHLRDTLQLQST